MSEKNEASQLIDKGVSQTITTAVFVDAETMPDHGVITIGFNCSADGTLTLTLLDDNGSDTDDILCNGGDDCTTNDGACFQWPVAAGQKISLKHSVGGTATWCVLFRRGV